jgi:hypothetical protein
MAAFNKFSQFVSDVANKVHNLGTDTLKIMLTNTTPTAASAIKSDIAEIAAQNGYPAGGPVVTITSSSQVGGLYRLIGNDVVFNGGGGSFGPFRYAIIYNSTAPNGNLIGWWDNGSSISVPNAQTFTVDLDQVNGILQLQ